MAADNGRDWREICKEVIREKDNTRLNVLLEELLEALEEHARKKPPTITDS